MRPMRALSLSDLDAIPRLGWVREPTPVTSLPGLAEALGVSFLGIKRDDLASPLHGGTKPRKLDYLLAAPPFEGAPAWVSSGGIGSGSLVAITAAAAELDRRLFAHLFWTPISAGIVDNLAFTASGPTTLAISRRRTTMALASPGVVIGDQHHGAPVIPPGATSPRGMIGVVRAGIELAEQIARGEVPEPDRVYVALGSGGTAVGLALGLALGGSRAQVIAVGVVERLLSPRARLRSLDRALRAELARFGIEPPSSPPPLVVDRAHLGQAYAHPTEASIAACARLAEHGIHLEPVYTGKAMAALLDDAESGRVKSVIFWSTVRGALPDPDPAWRDRLPPRLARWLDHPPLPDPVVRRRVLLGLGAAAAISLAVRVSGYDTYPGLSGAVLSSWEAQVIRAAGEALLGSFATAEQITEIAVRVDRYLTTMPPGVKREAHAMMALIEHGTTPLGRRFSRFTALSPDAREAFLSGLEARGGLFAQAYRGLRDLVMLGYYQQLATWKGLGYEGPKVSPSYDPRGPDRVKWAAYDALIAPAGEAPKGVVR